jgi:hypothetical protein
MPVGVKRSRTERDSSEYSGTIETTSTTPQASQTTSTTSSQPRPFINRRPAPGSILPSFTPARAALPEPQLVHIVKSLEEREATYQDENPGLHPWNHDRLLLILEKVCLRHVPELIV